MVAVFKFNSSQDDAMLEWTYRPSPSNVKMMSCPAFLHSIRLSSNWFKISTKLFTFYLLCSLFVSYNFPLSPSCSSISCPYHTERLLSSLVYWCLLPWTRWLPLVLQKNVNLAWALCFIGHDSISIKQSGNFSLVDGHLGPLVSLQEINSKGIIRCKYIFLLAMNVGM